MPGADAELLEPLVETSPAVRGCDLGGGWTAAGAEAATSNPGLT
jgi:hypothetical protein